MGEQLLANNRAWAAAKTRAQPDFFKRLTGQHTPHSLWFACATTRMPSHALVPSAPRDIRTHRTVANLAPPQDANYLSVLQFAVEVLRVKHILVTGHYGCGGVAAAVDDQRHGLIDHWLHPIREVAEERREELEAIADPTQRHHRLCELNVVRQVKNVASDIFVQDAWTRGQPVCVHGWIYSIATGLVTDLDCSVAGPDDYARVFGRR